MPETAAGYTVTDISRRLRIGEEKVRSLIKRGEIRAINTSDARCARPRYVVTPEALSEFEQARAVTPPPKPARRRKRTAEIDFYPD